MPDSHREIRVSEVLFDLDGTLIDSIAAVEDAWSVWAGEASVVLPDGMQLHGRTAPDIVSTLVTEDRIPAAVTRLSELEQHPTVPVRPTAGARELIVALDPARWAIVTSAARAVALARMAAANLPKPSLMVSGDDVTNGKPDPEPFRSGRRFPEGKAVAFEDSVSGLRSAKAAGCFAVGVIGTESSETLAPYADLLVRSLADVSVLEKGPEIVLSISPVRPGRIEESQRGESK